MSDPKQSKFGLPTIEVKAPIARLNWLTAVAQSKDVGEPGLRVAIFLADRLNGKTGKFTWSREWIQNNLDINTLKVKRALSSLTKAGFLDSKKISFNGKWQRVLCFPAANINTVKGANNVPTEGAEYAPSKGTKCAPFYGAESDPLTRNIQKTIQNRRVAQAKASDDNIDLDYENSDRSKFNDCSRPVCADAHGADQNIDRKEDAA